MNPDRSLRSRFNLSHHFLSAVLLICASPTIVRPQSAATPPSNAAHPDSASAPAPSTSNPPANQARTSQAPAATTAADAKTEVNIQDSGTTFRLHVNLVQVHVVVRDDKGNPVNNLSKDDFLLYDQGKLQSISTFAVETRQTRLARAEALATTQIDESAPGKASTTVLPDRFVALVFDDTHLSQEDILTVRIRVAQFLDGVPPTDRIGIFTASGQVTHGFTSDQEALKKTLLSLIPRNRSQRTGYECPNVTHYEADQVENQHNNNVYKVIVQETLDCAFNGDPRQIVSAESMAHSALLIALTQGDAESQFLYAYLGDVIHNLAAMPGERVLVMLSPGFLLTTQQMDLSHVVDLANRASIVINAIDGRGLYTPDMGDISKPDSPSVLAAGYKASYRISAQEEQQFVLRDMAFGTGGTFFHNSNDLASGLERVGAAPEIAYVLGFSPLSEKMDGQFHNLKVSLAGKRKLSIQARSGYYAPKKLKDPEEQAKREIQDAVFSRDEILDLPLQLQTQYFKAEDSSIRLSVVSHVQINGVHFRKADGRNLDNLTLATVIFDDNGNFVTGGEKLVTMKLLDSTYQRLSRTGLVVKTSFDVKPGRYMIRQVVRDSEGSQMAARNGAVEIPY